VSVLSWVDRWILIVEDAFLAERMRQILRAGGEELSEDALRAIAFLLEYPPETRTPDSHPRT